MRGSYPSYSGRGEFLISEVLAFEIWLSDSPSLFSSSRAPFLQELHPAQQDVEKTYLQHNHLQVDQVIRQILLRVMERLGHTWFISPRTTRRIRLFHSSSHFMDEKKAHLSRNNWASYQMRHSIQMRLLFTLRVLMWASPIKNNIQILRKNRTNGKAIQLVAVSTTLDSHQTWLPTFRNGTASTPPASTQPESPTEEASPMSSPVIPNSLPRSRRLLLSLVPSTSPTQQRRTAKLKLSLSLAVLAETPCRSWSFMDVTIPRFRTQVDPEEENAYPLFRTPFVSGVRGKDMGWRIRLLPCMVAMCWSMSMEVIMDSWES